MKKNRILQRFLAFLLTAAMLVTYMPSSVYALDDDSADTSEVAANADSGDSGAEAKKEAPKKAPAPAAAPAEKADPAPAPEPETPVVPEKSQVEEAKESETPETRAGPSDDSEDVKEEATEEVSEEISEEAADTTEEATEEASEEVVLEEEEALEEEEEEEEEPGLNENTLTFTGSANSVNVKVVAQPGTFPEGTTMKVVSVSKGAVKNAVERALDDVNDFRAVDITFYADGKEVQPKKNVSVRLSTSAFDTEEDLSVVHVKGSGAAEVMSLTSASDSVAQFKSDSFSIYVVVDQGTDDDARLKVTFSNGSSEIATVYVKKNDLAENRIDSILYDPGAGELASGVLFEGWTENKNYAADAAAITIEDVRDAVKAKLNAGVEEGDSVTYYAKLVKQYNVSYLDANGTALGASALKVRADAGASSVDYTVNQAYIPDGEENFEGWNVTLGGNNIEGYTAGKVYPNGSKVKLTGSVIFSVNAPKGHWLVFHENKGTYVAPQFVKSGETTKEPTVEMVRNGYTFDGWYSDADLTQKFTFGSTISDTVSVYAKWTPAAKAPYTILIWKQNVNDGKNATDKTYDFVEAIGGEGTVGQVINTSSYTSRAYEGFTFSKADENVRISPEGNAVANVYYDRNLITLTFRYRQNGQWQTQATMTGLYGQTLAQNDYTWPTNRWWYDSYTQSWGTYYGSGSRTTFLDAFIIPGGASSKTFYGFAGSGDNTVYFYQQNADGNYPALNAPTNTATVSDNGTFYITDKYNGFKAVAYSKDGTNWTQLGEKGSDGTYATVNNFSSLYIRFERVKYNLLYMDGVYADRDGNPVEGADSRGQLKVEKDIVYGADLKDHNKGGSAAFEPTYSGYTFDGWYVDEKCTQKYTFSTMPEGLTVYAKWVQNYYRVFLNPNAGTDASLTWGSSNVSTSFLVANGGTISVPHGTRDEFEFVGWFLSDGTFFNADAFVAASGIASAYSKTESTERDKWGNPTSSENKDEDRDWVVGKIQLEGKWRAALTGANGIGIVYDATADGTNPPTDNTLYVDSALAIAGAASTPKDATKQFDYWIVQTWDKASNSFKDTDTKVFPGEEFTVLKANAKVVENEGSTPEEPSFTYTVQLKAVYGPKESPEPTHITWHSNNGKDQTISESEDLQINEAVNIKPANTFSYDGYEFIGWSKWSNGSKPSSPTDDSNMFLAWNGSAFTSGGKTATRIAADEVQPYDDLYAVWRAKDVNYKVEFYYQNDNGEGYTKDDDLTATRQAKTDSTVNVTDADKGQTKDGKYKLVNGEPSVFTATVAGDGSTVLKLYFELNEAAVTVHHYLKGTTTKVADDTTARARIGSEYTAQPVAKFEEKDLTVDSYNPSQKITVKTADNVITIYYTLPLEITTGSASKAYDGKPLTNSEASITGLLSTDKITVEATGSQKEVGKSNNTYKTGKDIPGYYVVTEKLGTLEVTKSTTELKVVSKDGTWTYDGNAHTKHEYTVTYGEESYDVTIAAGAATGTATLSTGDVVTITPDAAATITHVAPAPVSNAFSYTVAKADQYETKSKEEGTLTVTKAPLTVTTESASKPYDGKELTAGGSIDGFVTPTGGSKETATFTVTGSQTTVGSSNNTYTLVWDGTALESDYDLNENLGTLTVSKDSNSLTIVSGTQSWPYDGSAHTEPVYTVNYGETSGTAAKAEDGTYTYKLSTGDTIVITPAAAATVTHVADGTVKNAFSYTLEHADQYSSVTKTEGNLSITPLEITLTSPNAEKSYDGTALTTKASEITPAIETVFPEGEGVEITMTGSQTLVGSSQNTFSYEFKEGTAQSDYSITTVFGTLTVTDTDDDKDVVNKTDGKDGAVYQLGDTVEWTVTVTNIYDEEKTLTVTEAAGMTIVSDVPEKLAAGKSVTITVQHVVTVADVEKGSIKNDVTVKLGDIEKHGDDTVETDPIEIEITAKSDKKVYDGEELTNDGWTKTAGTLAEGDEIKSVKVEGSQTLVGSSANVASDAKIVDKNGADVTKGYKITYVDGTLTVTDGTDPEEEDVPNELVVTKTDGKDGAVYHLGDTVEWTVWVKNIYDETKTLTVTEIEGMEIVGNVPETLAAGEEIEIKVKHVVTAADVAAKSIENDVTVKIGDLEKNGEDTVDTEQIEITITADSDKKVYDGKELTNDGWKHTAGTLATGDQIESVTVTGTQTLVGSSANVASNAKIVDKDGEDVSAGYKVTYVDGTLTVTDGKQPGDEEEVPDELVVTKTDGKEDAVYHIGDTIEWTVWVKNIYDETKTLKVTEAADMIIESEVPETLTAGQEIEIKVKHVVTPEDVVAGSIKNDVKVKIGDLEKEGDDTVETEPIKITIKADSAKKVYDGEALTKNSWTKTSGDLASGHQIVSVKVAGSQTLVGSSANVASDAKIINKAGADVTKGYDITYVNGTLTVTDGKQPDDEEEVPDDKVVKKTSNGATYRIGDTIQWTVWVKNIYEEEKTLKVTEAAGMNIVSTVPETLDAGQEIEIKVQHVVTAADVVAGKVRNDVTVKLGDLEKHGDDTVVTKKLAITITAGSGRKVYDGTALRVNRYSMTAGNLASGDRIASVKVTGSRTAVGTSKNVPSNAKIVNAAGADVTATYDITYVNGTLRVTRAGGGGGNPTPGGNPGGNPGGPGITPATPDADGAAVVPEQPVPEAEPEIDIPDEGTPLAAGAWALINLICAIATALGAIVALFRKKEEDDEDEDEQNKPKTDDEEEEDDNRGKKMLAAKIAGAVAGVAGPIAFILTEDMTLPMQMIDKWTLLMVVILAAQIVAAIFNKKASELDDEEEEEVGAEA